MIYFFLLSRFVGIFNCLRFFLILLIFVCSCFSFFWVIFNWVDFLVMVESVLVESVMYFFSGCNFFLRCFSFVIIGIVIWSWFKCVVLIFWLCNCLLIVVSFVCKLFSFCIWDFYFFICNRDFLCFFLSCLYCWMFVFSWGLCFVGLKSFFMFWWIEFLMFCRFFSFLLVENRSLLMCFVFWRIVCFLVISLVCVKLWVIWNVLWL